MKKRRVIGSAALTLVMGMSMFATAAFGQLTNSQESYRVLIKGPEAEKAKARDSYGVRWDFGSKGFTTTVNENQYIALLKNKNLSIEKVPEVQVEKTVESTGKTGGTTTTRPVPSDPTPRGIEAIYHNSSIAATSGGNGVKVAVLDTGVYKAHRDLAANVEQCKDFTQTKSPMVDGTCSDGNGHGTHVSGTILANGGSDSHGIYGVAPEAKLWSYKVLNNRGSGYSDDIAAAINQVAAQVGSSSPHIIISMSLGSSIKDSLISSAVDNAYAKGVLIVAAAGNDGPTANTIGYPGALVNAVAVAALENVQESGSYRIADFSSRGNPDTASDDTIQERDVEFSAPGRDIESTWYNGAYNTISGTSMATPHISGLAAKIWAADSALTNTTLRAELKSRAQKYDIFGGYGASSGNDYASGFGFPRVQ